MSISTAVAGETPAASPNWATGRCMVATRGGGHGRRRVPTTAGCLRARDGRAPGAVEAPGGGGHHPPPPAARGTQASPHARREVARDQGPAGPGGLPEREVDLHPPRGARAHRG